MKCSKCGKDARMYYVSMGYLCDTCERKPFNGGEFLSCLCHFGLIIFVLFLAVFALIVSH